MGHRGLAYVAAMAVALGGCVSAAAMKRGAGEVRTGIGDAVSAPLEDLNIKRLDIPKALVRATVEPYDLHAMDRCERIAAEVGALDDALGPDLDEPAPPDTRVWSEKGVDAAATMTLNAVHDTADGVIPFRSWVRRLTGAERHRREVQEAIRAGNVRRAYLKGIGMRLNCAPPAAPSWFKPVTLIQVAEPAPAPAPVASKPDEAPSAPQAPAAAPSRSRRR